LSAPLTGSMGGTCRRSEAVYPATTTRTYATPSPANYNMRGFETDVAAGVWILSLLLAGMWILSLLLSGARTLSLLLAGDVQI
jgi:hypothetical protein